MSKQIPDLLVTVRPKNFGSNPETAASNKFQKDADRDTGEISASALEEFDNFQSVLKEKNIPILVMEEDPSTYTPDAIFPNNWISFHPDGTVVIYPMESPTRRKERRYDILEELENKHQFHVRRIIDFTCFESRKHYLESTGSIVFDYPNNKGYICRSSRSSEVVIDALSKLLNFQPVCFNAIDKGAKPIYHTNVMMCMAELFCVICLESIGDPGEREMVRRELEGDEKEIVSISLDQVYSFAGNMLQIRDQEGKKYLIMSDSAFHSLEPGQVNTIQKYCEILHVPIPTIERYGGGSIRCMLAGVMLPFKNSNI